MEAKSPQRSTRAVPEQPSRRGRFPLVHVSRDRDLPCLLPLISSFLFIATAVSSSTHAQRQRQVGGGSGAAPTGLDRGGWARSGGGKGSSLSTTGNRALKSIGGSPVSKSAKGVDNSGGNHHHDGSGSRATGAGDHELRGGAGERRGGGGGDAYGSHGGERVWGLLGKGFVDRALLFQYVALLARVGDGPIPEASTCAWALLFFRSPSDRGIYAFVPGPVPRGYTSAQNKRAKINEEQQRQQRQQRH